MSKSFAGRLQELDEVDEFAPWQYRQSAHGFHHQGLWRPVYHVRLRFSPGRRDVDDAPFRSEQLLEDQTSEWYR